MFSARLERLRRWRAQHPDAQVGGDARLCCLLGATFFLFRAVPGGFVPAQDKQYLVGFAQLPDGATLDRTEEVIRRMSEIALKEPGVEMRSPSRACRSTASPIAPTPASSSRR